MLAPLLESLLEHLPANHDGRKHDADAQDQSEARQLLNHSSHALTLLILREVAKWQILAAIKAEQAEKESA